jgi:uncharacterized membrane protein
MRKLQPPTLLLGMVLAVSSWWLPTTEAGAKTPAGAVCRNTTQYSVIEVPISPSVISSTGVIAGTTEVHRAALWRRGGGVQELSIPAGFHFTDPVAILKSGDIVVNAIDAQARRRGAFIYSGDSVAALAGDQTVAHGVSPMGVVVGEWVPQGKGRSEAVYWIQHAPQSLDLCCGGMIKGANRAGIMVGDAYDEQGRYHAFEWSPVHGRRMLGPTDRYSSAVAINEAGHALLQVGREGYLEAGGELRRLELSGRFYNSIRSMNDCDVVVGGYGPDSDHYRAFVWSAAGGFRDLDSLVAADSGWTLGSATAVNDRGEIVGVGVFHREESGFLLVPRR